MLHVAMTTYACCKPMLSTSGVSDVCFKSSIWMLHVAMTVLACFKRVLQVFHMFHTYVASISSGCCYAYTRMFQAHVLSVHLFQTYIANVSPEGFKSRSRCCMAPVAGGKRPVAAACCCCWGVAVGQPTWVPRAGTVLQQTLAPTLGEMRTRGRGTGCGRGMWAGSCSRRTSRPDVRALALPIEIS
jgi:hypothetical protein